MGKKGPQKKKVEARAPAAKRIASRAFVATLPVLAGYITMGFAAGLLLSIQYGTAWSALWAPLTSGTFISGMLQYLLLDWLREATPYIDVVIVTVCINIRYSLYGISLIERFKAVPILSRLYLIGTVTDESYALQTQCPWPPGGASNLYCLLIALFDHVYWIIGTTSGALCGLFAQEMFSRERVEAYTKGIDFAMTALFIVILVDQLRSRENRAPAVIGFVASTLVFASIAAFSGFAAARGGMLIPTMVLIVCAFLALRGRLDPKRRRRATA